MNKVVLLVLAVSVCLHLFGGFYYYLWSSLEKKDFWNIFILSLTLIALVWSTVQTNKNVAESQLSDIRPIILRDGVISNDWNDLRKELSPSHPLNFSVGKNYATNIESWIIYNKKKYPLYLAIGSPDLVNPKIIRFSFDKKTTQMGWMSPGTFLGAYTDWVNSEDVDKENQIQISYRDIQGNKYCTTENKDLLPSISKCN